MGLRLFKKTKETEQTERLEDKIMRFMRKVNLLQEEQPKLAYRFLQQAAKLYHQEFNGLLPNDDNDRKYNRVFLSFIEMYPPKITRESNPALV